MLKEVHKLNENQDLKQEIFDFVASKEGDASKPYFDIVQKPTIGYGVNLDVKDYREFVFDSMNITDKKHQEALTKVMNEVTKEFEDRLQEAATEGEENKDKMAKNISGDLADNINYAYKHTYLRQRAF